MLLRLSILLTLTIVLLIKVDDCDSIYAYAIKGIVKDVRLRPTKFIGGWFFKKAFILKKLKLKWKLKKKLILKKLLKKLLLIGKWTFCLFCFRIYSGCSGTVASEKFHLDK